MLLSDEHVIKQLRRSIDRHNKRRWSEGLVPLLVGIAMIVTFCWVFADVHAQNGYIRMMSKTPRSAAQVDALMKEEGYRPGFATGMLLGIQFMIGTGLALMSARSLRRRPFRQEDLLLRLWEKEPTATTTT